MNINKRLFGSPIKGRVRTKLEERQKLAEKPQPNDSIQFNTVAFTDNDKVVNDLGSRTPFIRMWTSVKLIEPSLVHDVLEEFEYIPGIPSYNSNGMMESQVEADLKHANQIEEQKLEFLATLNYTPKIITIKNDEDGSIKYYVVKELKGKNGEILNPRDQIDYASKVYMVGNHNYQKNYGEVATNDSLSYYVEDSDSEYFDSSDRMVGDRTVGEIAEEILPQELKTNKFMKPQAGITGLTSNTEGTLGVIKKTTINFLVHNFTDYDKIYNKYFLKPGATVFVDFGWSSIPSLYKPLDLIEASSVDDYLYNEETGQIVKSKGDLEVLKGIVTDYNSKVLPNGSVDCSVTLTSQNSALLGFETDEKKTRMIENILNHGILYLAVKPTLKYADGTLDTDINGEQVEIKPSDSDFLKNTPNAYWSADEIDNFNQNLIALAQKQVGSIGLTPSGNAIRTGVFINSYEVDDVYISFGLFEDLIINSQFGFGKGINDINVGSQGQIRMDSSISFTTFNQLFLEKQTILDKVPEEPPSFLYPKYWGNRDLGIDHPSPGGTTSAVSGTKFTATVDNGGSYTFQSGKYPYEFYVNTKENPLGQIELGSTSFHKFDQNINRIPIRELFIKTEVIINAFETQPTVKKIISEILDKVNEESDGIMQLQISRGGNDNTISIIDLNHNKTQNDINNSNTGDDDSENEAFKDLFTFNVMSPNSIVKDYNLEFKLPTGNIGNMYAILGMDTSNKSYPATSNMDDILAIDSIDDNNLSTIYEPDLGSFRMEQLSAQNNNDGSLIDVYQNAKNLLDNNTYAPNTLMATENIIPEPLHTKIWDIEESDIRTEDTTKSTNDDNLERLRLERLLEINIGKLESMGFRVVGDFRDYFKIKERQEITIKEKSNLLPYTLTLSIYGIASIVPGDTFRVDYLPKVHLDNTYLQTMRVAHNVNSDGWNTVLETQYMIRPSVKLGSYRDVEISGTRLSPKVLNTLKLKEWHALNPSTTQRHKLGALDRKILKNTNGTFEGELLAIQKGTTTTILTGLSKINKLYPYMSGIQIMPSQDYKFLSMVLMFTWVGEDKKVFFPQDNFCNWSREQYVDFAHGSAQYFESGLAPKITTYLTGEEEQVNEGNSNIDNQTSSKWINFPHTFQFGGYVGRQDFYNPDGDKFFDEKNYYFDKSVFERLMETYGSGRLNENGEINPELMYTGANNIKLEKGKNYFMYINGNHWAMAPTYGDTVASNWTDYDKMVNSVILDAKQCKGIYWNQVAKGKWQSESNKKMGKSTTTLIDKIWINTLTGGDQGPSST